MKTRRTFVIALGLGLALTAALFAETSVKQATPTSAPAKAADTLKAQTPKKIQWLAYDQGLANAKKSNKYMFVDFTASWCGWCKKMEAETFSKPEVISMISEHFVPIKVWGDSDSMLNIDGYKISQKDYVASRGVQGFPTFVFEAPTRDQLTGFSGYRDAPTLMQYLTQVKTFIDTAKAKPAPAGQPSGK